MSFRSLRVVALEQCIQGLIDDQSQFDSVQEQDTDWILERLYWHKLLPLAAACYDPSVKTNNQLKKKFETVSLQNLSREARYKKQVRWLFQLMQEHNIKAIPYKGPFWSQAIFPTYSWRHIGDIDLLMSLEDAKKLHRILIDTSDYFAEIMGPSAEDDFEKRGELTCPPVKGKEHLFPIQLHWQLVPAPRFVGKFFLYPEDFFENTTTKTWEGVSYEVPTKEVQFLYYALHATCQHQFNRMSLIVDMLRFLKVHKDLNWDKVCHLANSRGCSAPLFYTLKFLQYYRPDVCEKRIITTLRPHNYKQRLFASFYKPKMAMTVDDTQHKVQRKLFRAAMSW